MFDCFGLINDNMSVVLAMSPCFGFNFNIVEFKFNCIKIVGGHFVAYFVFDLIYKGIKSNRSNLQWPYCRLSISMFNSNDLI